MRILANRENRLSSDKFTMLQLAATGIGLAGLVYLFVTEDTGRAVLFWLSGSLLMFIDWHLNRRIAAAPTVLSLDPPPEVAKPKFRHTPLTWVGFALLATGLILGIDSRTRVFAVLAFVSLCVFYLDRYVRTRSGTPSKNR